MLSEADIYRLNASGFLTLIFFRTSTMARFCISVWIIIVLHLVSHFRPTSATQKSVKNQSEKIRQNQKAIDTDACQFTIHLNCSCLIPSGNDIEYSRPCFLSRPNCPPWTVKHWPDILRCAHVWAHCVQRFSSPSSPLHSNYMRQSQVINFHTIRDSMAGATGRHVLCSGWRRIYMIMA